MDVTIHGSNTITMFEMVQMRYFTHKFTMRSIKAHDHHCLLACPEALSRAIRFPYPSRAPVDIALSLSSVNAPFCNPTCFELSSCDDGTGSCLSVTSHGRSWRGEVLLWYKMIETRIWFMSLENFLPLTGV